MLRNATTRAIDRLRLKRGDDDIADPHPVTIKRTGQHTGGSQRLGVMVGLDPRRDGCDLLDFGMSENGQGRTHMLITAMLMPLIFATSARKASRARI